jgi:hypothetical protein
MRFWMFSDAVIMFFFSHKRTLRISNILVIFESIVNKSKKITHKWAYFLTKFWCLCALKSSFSWYNILYVTIITFKLKTEKRIIWMNWKRDEILLIKMTTIDCIQCIFNNNYVVESIFFNDKSIRTADNSEYGYNF